MVTPGAEGKRQMGSCSVGTVSDWEDGKFWRWKVVMVTQTHEMNLMTLNCTLFR